MIEDIKEDNSLNNKDDLTRLYEYDEQRFRQSYVADISTANQAQLTAKLIFSSHSLEKSLSNDNFETGRGLRAVQLLADILKIYRSKKYDREHLAYTSTLSVLREFYERHKNTSFEKDIERILCRYIKEIKKSDSRLGGAKNILSKTKSNNRKKNFEELSEGRYAVRSYSDRPVEKSDIEEVIRIAIKTPTVCNRQPVRVYAFYDKKIIKKILDVQGGIVHYNTPPVLLLVTVDDSSYIDINERNQGFIDGGLFAMSILYAIEYIGLAACPLHAMFAEIPDRTIRSMLDLPDSEKLITFISLGHFKEENNVCISFRYPVEHILSTKSKINDISVEDVERIVYADRGKSETIEIRTDQINFFIKVRGVLRLRTRARKVAAYLKDSHGKGLS